MTWSTTSDVEVFLAAAGDFLREQPVENTVLLTEAAYLAARPSPAADQLYGWWTPDGDDVAGAFLQAPAHPPILTRLPAEALESLAEHLPQLPPFGVDGRTVASAAAAWRRGPGVELAERSRVRLYRLVELRRQAPAEGSARPARIADRDLLVTWYAELMAASPGDPSELAYVVDDPISDGGMLVWEVAGTPVAMASRSRIVAGMTRLGAVYAPDDDRYGAAAFAAACAAALTVAHDVLAFALAGDDETDARYRDLGFAPVLDRVMLQLA